MSASAAMVISIIAAACIVILIAVDVYRGSLNIKSHTVGDGQYGTARFATNKEISDTFRTIPFEPAKWRKGKNLPHDLPGAVVLGYQGEPGHVKAMVDTSDSHTMVISSTGGGKTTFFLIPNLEMTCACGYSFLVTDTKGDNFRDFAGIAQKYYGYTCKHQPQSRLQYRLPL